MEREDITKVEGIKENTMDRKKALKTMGFVALSAATMMMLLSKPNKAVAASPAPPPDWAE